MSISLNTIYSSFAYIVDDIVNWNIDGKMNGDYVAGLLIALASILLEDGNFDSNRSVRLTSTDSVINMNFVRDAYLSVLADYYIMSSSKVSRYMSLPIEEEFTGIWVKIPYIEDLDLYTFVKAEFMDGFIYMCNVLNEDFREKIYGGPFIYNKIGLYRFIDILGYDIPPMPTINKQVSVYPIDENDFI